MTVNKILLPTPTLPKLSKEKKWKTQYSRRLWWGGVGLGAGAERRVGREALQKSVGIWGLVRMSPCVVYLALPVFAVQRTEGERKPLVRPKQDAEATVEWSSELNCTHTHSRNPHLWFKKKSKCFVERFDLDGKMLNNQYPPFSSFGEAT